MSTVLPFVISGIICVGVWVGVLVDRVQGWVICAAGHLSFILYGALTEHYGFMIIPPFTATGLLLGIVRERQRRAINPDTINSTIRMTKEERCS